MADRGGSSGPLSPYEKEQARLIAAYERKQTEIAERKDRLLDRYGAEFESRFSGLDDVETRKMAVDNLAAEMAKRGVERPELMDGRADAENRAISQAKDAEELRYAQEYQNDTRELSGTEQENSAAPLIEPATPAREAEQDPLQQQAETSDRQAEATPERPQERDPNRRPVGHYDDMKQQHAEIVANGGAQEPSQSQEPAKPEERGLRFYEDLNREHAEALDKDGDRSQEQGDAGAKKLSFYEDRNPQQNHDIEH